MCNIRRFYWLRELYKPDFHKLVIYGSGRVWANACDVFRRAPSQGGRGRWAAVDFVVCFGWGRFFRFFFFRTHTARCKYEPALPRLPPYLEEGLRCWSGFVRYSGLIGNIYSYLHV